MSQPQIRNCTHIKVNGVPCGSPALRGERFCYYHQRMLRGVRTPPRARLHPISQIEDPQSIQFALMEVINALLRDTIDVKRANLILRALHIAVKNIQYRDYAWGKPPMHEDEMVKEIPDYPLPQAATEATTAETAGEAANQAERSECGLPATAAYPPAKDATAYETRRNEAAYVGADAFVRPGVAAVAAAPTRRQTREELYAEYFNTPIPPANSAQQPAPTATTESPRKPPTSVREPSDARKKEVKAKAKRAHAS